LETLATGRPDTDIIFIVLLLAVVVYAYLFQRYGRSSIQILRCINDRNLSDRLHRENSRMINRPLAAMVVVSVFVIGIFFGWALYLVGVFDYFTYSSGFLGILSFGLLVVIRYTVLQALGLISDKRHFLDHVVFSFWTTLAFLGPVTIFIAALAVYGPEVSRQVFAWIGIGFLLIGYAMFMFRGVIISTAQIGVGPLHLFYYFCALEIMPCLLAYRTLLS
jgi:hypothetical protein